MQRYLKRYKIEVEVLHRGLLREGVYGWCDVSGSTYKPRSFLIEIHNRLNEEDYIKTLLHECEHVRQWVHGELKLKSSKKFYKNVCVEDLEYSEQPHEIEAHSKETELYIRYLTSLL